MMKNKIAISLGLMLALTAGISFADGTLPGPTEEIKPGSPAQIDTSGLSPNTYYDITCGVNNIHEENGVFMLDRIHSDVYSNMGPVLLNGVSMTPVDGYFKGVIKPGENTVEFQQFIIQGDTKGSYIKVKAKLDETIINQYGIFGFYVHDCIYTLAKAEASNGVTLPAAAQGSSESAISPTK